MFLNVKIYNKKEYISIFSVLNVTCISQHYTKWYGTTLGLNKKNFEVLKIYVFDYTSKTFRT